MKSTAFNQNKFQCLVGEFLQITRNVGHPVSTIGHLFAFFGASVGASPMSIGERTYIPI